ncbi:MAG: alpha/beta fold hydrolase [Fimbriimonas sp.]
MIAPLLPMLAALAQGPAVPPPATDVMGIAMEGYPYPYPVRYLPLENEGQPVRMAYMDVRARGTGNGRTVVLLHGKNFFGAYWRGTAEALAGRGFRVIVPDQIGFGKSSKPDLAYSFDLLARNTVALTDHLGVKAFAVVGHSMGGMLAVRLARAYPDRVERLVLENPIGLEDYQQVVPAQTTDTVLANEQRQTAAQYRDYVTRYYVRKDPGLIEPFVQIREAISRSAEFPRWAKSAALTYQMIQQQPTVYDLPNVKAPTLLVIGQADRTAVGANYAPEALRSTLGNYPELGRRAARTIPNAQLLPLENVGHIPHLEAPDRFHGPSIEFLSSASSATESGSGDATDEVNTPVGHADRGDRPGVEG